MLEPTPTQPEYRSRSRTRERGQVNDPRRTARLQALFEIVTILRIPLAIGMVAVLHQTETAIIFFFVIVLADIADGVFARHYGVDTDRRRMLDAVSDRLIIHLVAVATMLTYGGYWGLYLPLLVRDLLGSSVCIRTLSRHHVLLKGGLLHKAASLADGLLFLSIILGGTYALAAGIIAWAANYLLLADYIGAAYSVGERASTQTRSHAISRFELRQLLGARLLISTVLPRHRLRRQRLSARSADLRDHSSVAA